MMLLFAVFWTFVWEEEGAGMQISENAFLQDFWRGGRSEIIYLRESSARSLVRYCHVCVFCPWLLFATGYCLNHRGGFMY